MEYSYGIEYFTKENETAALFSEAKIYDVSTDSENLMDGIFTYEKRAINSAPYYKTRDEVLDLIKKDATFYVLDRIGETKYSCINISLSINQKGYINLDEDKEEDYVNNIRIKDY